MKATRRPLIAILCKAGRHRFWRWPLAFALALAVAVSLFHDLPALAGGGGSDPILVTVASSTNAPVQASDSQAPGDGGTITHKHVKFFTPPMPFGPPGAVRRYLPSPTASTTLAHLAASAT
jgi:hypothetical protein